MTVSISAGAVLSQSELIINKYDHNSALILFALFSNWNDFRLSFKRVAAALYFDISLKIF